MNILVTGGSGDVGSLLVAPLLADGHRVINLDLAAPKVLGADFVQGSILDRDCLARAMDGVDCVVHVAAWHGIHETSKTPTDFHDLNVTGTFNTLQAAVDAGVEKFIFISSTSVEDEFGIYGHTKILGEKMVEAYAHRHPDNIYLTLRPRAFIPPWNTSVYDDFLQWTAWFMKGAVHVYDFRDAILTAIEHTPSSAAPIYIIDGAYDYTDADLAAWGEQTFAKTYPAYVALAAKHGLDTSRKPRKLFIPEHMRLTGYHPRYSMKNLLEELALHGKKGPSAPF